MKPTADKSMKKATIFYEENKDYILDKLTGVNSLFSMELDTKELGRLFDQYAGIDYVLVNRKLSQLFGVAARVNFWWKTKGHLTIRYERKSGADTEYKKRKSSILSDDSLYPQITMQIDCSNDNKPEGGIMLKTKELYLYLYKNESDCLRRYMQTCKEGNKYLSIPYKTIENELNVKCTVF